MTPAPAPKSFFLSPDVHEYLLSHGQRPDAVQQSLIDATAALGPVAGMQIAPEQGALMTMLTQLVGASRAVEVGTFTGYSALCVARGLVAGGRLLCCDVSEEWTAIGRRHWEQAGVADRIDLVIAPAVDTLRGLPDDPTIDIAFIDADKPNYPRYFEELVRRMRPNGLILVDNVLWGGRVVESDAVDDNGHGDENTAAIRAFNDLVAADARVDAVMLPVSDGLTLLRKRP
jgi:caffeoyl-CoA O-methyltransferase